MIWQVAEGQQGGFSVETAEILLVSQRETSPHFAEFPKSPSRFLACGKLASQNGSIILSPLPPPGLRNTVRAQQILCNSFLGICQIALPTMVGLRLYPLQNNPCIAPGFGSSALFWYLPLGPPTHQNLVKVGFH